MLTANGPLQPRITGQQIAFPPVDSLPPGQKLTYTVEVEAVKAGDARFRVELRSATLKEPVVDEESTTIRRPSSGTSSLAAPASEPPPAFPPAGPNP